MWWSYVKIFKNSKALYESWKSQVQFSAQDISTFSHFNVVLKSSVSRQRIGKSRWWFWFPYLLHVWSHAFALIKRMFILCDPFQWIYMTKYCTWSFSLDTPDMVWIVSLKSNSYLFFKIFITKEYSRHYSLKLFSSSSKVVFYNEIL